MKKKTIKDCHDIAALKGGICLSTKYLGAESPIEWQCNKGHKWKTSLHAVKNHNQWCPTCAGTSKKSIEDARLLAKKRGGLCLSENIENTSSKIIWSCDKSHTWEASYNNVQRGTWCPYCNRLNKTEQVVRELFQQILNKNFPKSKIRIPDIKYPLELDGYCSELELAFEYDGEFHYRPWNKNKPETLEKTKYHDGLKDRWCADNGVQLIRIPYTKKENLKEFVLQKLKEIGYASRS